MPKVNNNILAVQQENSNVIKIYNIKLRQYTRQFIICKEEPVFEDFNANFRAGSALSGDYSTIAKEAKMARKVTAIEKALNKAEIENRNNKNKAPVSPFMEAYTMNREKSLQEFKN